MNTRLGLTNREGLRLVLVSLSLLVFVLIKYFIIQQLSGSAYTVLAAILIAALVYFFRRPSIGVPAANKLILRGIAALFIVYVVLGPWALPEYEKGYPQLLIIGVNLACIIFLGLSFRVESFIVPGLLLLVYQKNVVSMAWSLPISATDYMPLVEFGLLIGLAPVLMAVLQAVASKLNFRSEVKVDDQLWLFFIAVSVHCANYFFSGVQKLAISEPVWAWVTENPTLNLMLAAYETGSLPLTILGGERVSLIFSLLEPNIVAINAVTLIIQLSALVILRKVTWMIVAIVLFDITHVVIFLLTGIFFYKWIVLNALLVAALWRLRDYEISFKGYISLLFFMLVSPVFFFVAFLGWHDTPSFNDEYFVAHTSTNEVYRVPSNYFLASSVTYAQGRISMRKPGHFQTGPSGVLYNVRHSSKSWKDTMVCKFATRQTNASLDYSILKARMIKHHKFILQKVDEKGRFSYDLFPHHIWSMPWSHKSFNELDKRLIVGYAYVIESKCLSPNFTGLSKSNVLRKTEIYFDVQ